MTLSYDPTNWGTDLAVGGVPSGANVLIDVARLENLENFAVQATTYINQLLAQATTSVDNIAVIANGGSTAGIADGMLVFEFVPVSSGNNIFPQGPQGIQGPAGAVDTTGLHLYEWNGTSYVLIPAAKIFGGPAADVPAGIVSTDLWFKQ